MSDFPLINHKGVKKNSFKYILRLLAGKFGAICTEFPLTTFWTKNSKWLPLKISAKIWTNIASYKTLSKNCLPNSNLLSSNVKYWPISLFSCFGSKVLYQVLFVCNFFTSFNTAQTNCKIQSLFFWFWFPRFKYLHQIGDEKTVVIFSKELVFFRIDILRLQSNLFYSKNKILQKSYNCRISWKLCILHNVYTTKKMAEKILNYFN